MAREMQKNLKAEPLPLRNITSFWKVQTCSLNMTREELHRLSDAGPALSFLQTQASGRVNREGLLEEVSPEWVLEGFQQQYTRNARNKPMAVAGSGVLRK